MNETVKYMSALP